MPTAAELQILITAQDDASVRLRQIGTQVAALSQQVDRAGAGFGTRLATGVSGVADAMRIVGAVARTAGDAIGAVVGQIREGFATNVELERATIAFRRYTGSAEEANQIIAALRREAAVTPFNDQEIISAGRALISYARGSTQELLGLVRVAEQLAVLDPFQGIQGGIVALQEALSGSFESLVDRFEIPRTLIEQLRTEGVPNLEIVKRALEFRGIDTGAIEAFGRSFEGLQSTIESFGQELRGLATAGLFEALGQAFAHVVALIDRYGDQLRAVAAGIGETLRRLATTAAQALEPLLGLLDRVLPGFREFAQAEFGRPVEVAADGMARLQQAAAQTGAPLAAVNRELGQLGVRAAEIQIGADRIRRGYEAQLRPLERQLELLQNSAEVQRIQQALASNRAATERLRLDQEVTALQRAARGREDPDAPGLTTRQRAIALALQERRLQLQGLQADRERAPAIQSLQERIADIRRREAEALDPSERLLETYRDRVAVLQTESQRLQNIKAALDEQTAAIKAQQDQVASGPGDASHQQAVADAKKRGQQVADEWLKAYTKWVDDNGGTLWDAVVNTFNKWWAAGGKEEVTRIGALIGGTLWQAVLAAVTAGPSVEDIINAKLDEAFKSAQQRFRDFLNNLAQEVFGPAAAPGGPLGPGGPFAVLPQGPMGPAPVGGPLAPVNVGDVSVNVSGVQDQALSERLKAALTNFLRMFILTQGVTDAGASPNQQGAGRAP